MNVWLNERGITPEEDFVTALNRYVENHKKIKNVRNTDVYSDLGVSKQTVHNWRQNLSNTQSQSKHKREVIRNAGQLFMLSPTETERLANKAGLSLAGGSYFDESTIKEPNVSQKPSKKPSNTAFESLFKQLLTSYKGTEIDLYESALVSDQMFRYIKAGKHLRKEPILSLLIVMEVDLYGIQAALSKAGYILSKSITNDLVVMWMIENRSRYHNGAKHLNRANTTLEELGATLLMTRIKEEKQRS